MTALTTWYDEIMPDLSGVTAQDSIVLHSILNAAIMYLRLTKAYEIDHPAINVVANQANYPLAPGANLVPVVPVRVYYNGELLTPSGEDDLDAVLGSKWRTEADTPSHYYLPDEETIALARKPSADLVGGLTMRIAVTLGTEATDIPAVYWNQQRHRDAIANAALAMMHEKKNRPYSNPDAAAVEWAAFHAAVGSQSGLQAAGRTKAPLRTRVVHGIM